jgi:hypothetical protein
LRRLRTLSTIAIGVAAVAAAVATPAYASAPSSHAQASRAQAGHAQASSVRVATPGGIFTVELRHIPRGAIQPRSDSGCVGNLPWNNISTCIAINGQSTYVSTMTGDSEVKNYAVVEHVLLSGPSVYYNTPDFVVDVGDYIEVTWAPYRNVYAGSYCATSWVVIGANAYSNQGAACQPVNP